VRPDGTENEIQKVQWRRKEHQKKKKKKKNVFGKEQGATRAVSEFATRRIKGGKFDFIRRV